MIHSCIVVAVMVGSWAIILSFVGAFICNPVQKAWNPQLPGTCLDLVSFYYGLQIPNIVTDIIILVMPIKVILNLPLSKPQKVSLLGIFAVGGLYALLPEFLTCL
jgi:hypothetical protein